MGVSYSEAKANLDAAVKQIFAADPTVRAVGITHHQGRFGYRAIRNAAALTPQGGVGVNGTQFSDHGDSGSAIVRENGEIVGLLYAGNGQQTYACPIDAIFHFFNCTLA